MPHEKIKHEELFTSNNQLVVGWHGDGQVVGWVQVSVVPPGWTSTGDWSIVDMTAKDIDKLIKVLKKARNKAYPRQRGAFDKE
jgi:hypothetical protein